MYGVKFGNKHSDMDLGMIMTHYQIGQAAPRRYLQSVPGRNGLLDLTSAVTPVQTYDNRQLQFEFVWKEKPENYEDKVAEITRLLHGKKMHVILDNDPDYYYDGFVTIPSRDFPDYEKAELVVNVDAFPYKMQVHETTVQITGSGTISCMNDSLQVVPKVVVSAETTIVFGSKSITFAAGTYLPADLQLSEGRNDMTVTGSGTTKVIYRQGRL